jgi:hypothetical protein
MAGANASFEVSPQYGMMKFALSSSRLRQPIVIVNG